MIGSVVSRAASLSGATASRARFCANSDTQELQCGRMLRTPRQHAAGDTLRLVRALMLNGCHPLAEDVVIDGRGAVDAGL